MAKNIFRKIIKKTLLIFNGIVVALFLLACLAPWLSPEHFWWVGFAGLMIPYLILLLLFSIIFWLMVKPALALIPLITLAIGWKQINVIFAFHIKTQFDKNKPADCLRIADWNIRSFNGLTENKDVKKRIREEVAETIIRTDADVVCLQEFNTSTNHAQDNNIILFSKAYPFSFFSRDYDRNGGEYESGCIIFSRYPIVDSGKIRYPGAESLIYADIAGPQDTIRIYTTHLQSFKFRKEDYDDMEKIKQQDEDALAASRNIFQKMRLAFRRRGVQANMVKEETDKCPRPSVVCGDFNDVPGSYAYFHVKGSRTDAFLEKGFGIGRTYLSLASTLRIDYILPDDRFEVRQFNMVDEGLSDHNMLLSDIHLKK